MGGIYGWYVLRPLLRFVTGWLIAVYRTPDCAVYKEMTNESGQLDKHSSDYERWSYLGVSFFDLAFRGLGFTDWR